MTTFFKESYRQTHQILRRFVSFNRIYAFDSTNQSSFRILHKAVLADGEVLVALVKTRRHSDSINSDRLALNIDDYIESRGKNSLESEQSKINWQMELDNSGVHQIDRFSILGINPFYSWESRSNHYRATSDSLHYRMFYYLSDSCCSGSTTIQKKFSASNGLWSAYLNAVVNKLVIDIYNKHMKTDVKSLADFYNEKTISFSQVINSTKISHPINKISIKYNYLSIQSIKP